MQLNLNFRMLVAGCALVLGGLMVAPVQGADPEFVGGLALLEDAKIVADLELSEAVQEKLKTLVTERIKGAEDIVLSKDLAPEERTAKMKVFAAESEKLGLALLSEEQKTKFAQLRIAREGFITLADPKIAEEVGLAKEQKKQVDTLIAELKAKLAKGTSRERQTAKGEYERKLSSILSKDQKAKWNALVGKAPAPSAAVKVTEENDPIKPEKEPGTTKPAVASKSPGKSESKPAAAEAKKDAKLKFQFVYAAYKDVLDWLCEQADLSLLGDNIPPGTFNYTDTREYTPSEAIDRINRVLQFKGYMLVRDGRMLMVINQDEGIPPGLFLPIDVSQLDDKGESEIVTVLLQLTRMAPEEAAGEVEKMKSPFGSIIILGKARQLLVSDSVGRLRLMRKMINAVENPNQGDIDGSPQWETYPLAGFDSTIIMQILESVLVNLPEKKIAIDPKAGVIMLHTVPAGHKKVKAMLSQLQKDGPTTVVIKVKSDPQALVLQINKLFGTGDAGSTSRVEADPIAMQIMIHGSKGQVEQIRKYLEDKQEIDVPVESGPTVRSTRRTITIAGTAAQQRMLEAAASTFERKFGNPVKMPKFTEGATGGAGSPGFGQGFDPRGGGFDGRGYGRGGFPDQPLIGPGYGAPGGPQGPAEPPRTETPKEAAPARPTTSGFAPRAVPKAPMTPPAAKPAEAPKVEAPKTEPPKAEAPKSEKMARRGTPSRYQFVGFGQEEPAKEPAKPEAKNTEPAQPAAAEPPTNKPAKESAAEEKTVEPAKEPPADEKKEEPAKEETKPAKPADTLDDLIQKYGPEVVVYVAQLFKDLDKNNDLSLDTEERKAHKWATPIEDSDTNKDDRISFEEMCIRKAKSVAEAQAAPEEKTVPGAPITITVTSAGITIRSDDLDALDEFESILQELAAAETDPVKRLKTIKLRFIKADNAAALIQEILSGGSSADSGGGGGGSLMGDVMGMMVPGMNNLLGSGGGGTTTTGSTSAISIVADPRRNELWVSATTRDFDRVQEIVQAIDRMPEEGIETTPPPRYIKVRNQNAEDIATKIRTLYAGRLGGDSSSQNRQPNPADIFNALRGRGGSQNKPTKGEEIKMTLAVDERSNQLIVSAPDYLFHEIEQLVKDLDTATVSSDEVMAVVKLEGANADLIQRSLTKMFPSVTTGRTAQTTQTGLARNGTNGANGTTQNPNTQSQFNPGMLGLPGIGGFPGGGFPGGGFPGGGGGFPGGGGGFGRGGGGGGFPGGGGGFGRGGGGGGFPGGGGGFPGGGGGGGFPGGGGGGRGGGGGGFPGGGGGFQ